MGDIREINVYVKDNDELKKVTISPVTEAAAISDLPEAIEQNTEFGYIQDETRQLFPRRKYTRFLNVDIVDDEPNDTIDVDLLTFDRPFRPTVILPKNGDTDITVLCRLESTQYFHPYNFPVGGVRWQIYDGDTLIYDVIDRSASMSHVVSTDEHSQNVLSPDTTYTVKCQHIDLRDVESLWSDEISFTTESTFSANVILAPEILAPVDQGWVPEKKLMVVLSTPVVMGTVVPDKSEVQVALTSDFATLIHQVESFKPTFVVDNTVDFSNTAAPIYVRARQKDTVNSVISRWSAVPTVWLQRAFRDFVVGIGVVADGVTHTGITFNCDRDGKPVMINSEYWDDHPIYATIAQEVTDNFGNKFSMFPRCWSRVKRDGNRYYWWVSPFPLADFDIDPAFVYSPDGFWRGRYLSGNPASSVPGVAAFRSTASTTLTDINNIIHALNIASSSLGSYRYPTCYEQALVNKLAAIEGISFNHSILMGGASFNIGHSSTGAAANTYNALASMWRGLHMEIGGNSTVAVAGGAVQLRQSLQAFANVANPFGPTTSIGLLDSLFSSPVPSYHHFKSLKDFDSPIMGCNTLNMFIPESRSSNSNVADSGVFGILGNNINSTEQRLLIQIAGSGSIPVMFNGTYLDTVFFRLSRSL